MLIYVALPHESICGGGHSHCLGDCNFGEVCPGFRKPRYGNILPELIQVIMTPIVTRGSYPRNVGEALEREGVGAGKALAESLGNRRRPRLRSDASGCFGVTEGDVREHTCAPVCDHPG